MDEEVHSVRHGKGVGASVLRVCHSPGTSTRSALCKLSKPFLLGLLWRFHWIGIIDPWVEMRLGKKTWKRHLKHKASKEWPCINRPKEETKCDLSRWFLASPHITFPCRVWGKTFSEMRVLVPTADKVSQIISVWPTPRQKGDGR